jgi:hypothetical protein
MPGQTAITSAAIVAVTDHIKTALPKLKASFHTGTLDSYEVTQILAMLTYAYAQAKITYAVKTEADAYASSLQA